jgi:hypothetical protein
VRRLAGAPSPVSKNVPAVFLGILLSCLALGAEPSKALEAPRVFRGVLVLEGRIVFGDYDRLRHFLSDKATFDKISNGVFLASPGGNLGEAIRLGRLIRALQLSTTAPSGPPEGRKLGEALIGPYDLRNPRMNYQCASACFLLFVSGIYRSVNWAGRLGIHRPFQMSGDAPKVKGSDEILNGPVRKAIENYLREMGVRIKYVDLMYSVPSSQLRQVTQEELDDDLLGFTPDQKDRIRAQCDEKTAAAAKPASDTGDCRTQLAAKLRAELPAQGWQKVYGGK